MKSVLQGASLAALLLSACGYGYVGVGVGVGYYYDGGCYDDCCDGCWDYAYLGVPPYATPTTA